MIDSSQGLAASPELAVFREALAERLQQHLHPQLHADGLAHRPEVQAALDRLWAAMRHGVLNGGKRARGLLVMAAAKAVGANPLHSSVIDLAVALECIHAFSLVHDDMPCMDDDDLRRGQPTVHIAFDEAMALLVGDALQTLGFELVLGAGEGGQSTQDDAFRPEQRLAMARTLARATGARGMAGGQAIDIQMVGQSMGQAALEEMHGLKTGALICAAVELGALSVWPPQTDQQAALQGFARAIGLAFQVLDDWLDVQADSATLGKTAGKDGEQNKPTFVSLLGVDQTRAYAHDLHTQAMKHLEALGPSADALRALALALTQRTH